MYMLSDKALTPTNAPFPPLLFHLAARILCRVLDRCGSWDCRISDFMCPRHEYNWADVPYGLNGDCKSGANRGVRWNWRLAGISMLAAAVVTAALV